MTIMTDIYQQDDNLHVKIQGIDFISMAIDWPFEKITYFIFYKKVPTDDELIHFNERGYEVRRITAESIKSKQRFFASPLTTLQSLAASVTVYYDHWDYLNQLMMSFYTFYRYPLPVLNNYESQLQCIVSAHNYPIKYLPYFVSLMNLYSENGLSVPTLVARGVASTQAETPSAFSAALGALSGPLQAKKLECILPMLNEMNFANFKRVIHDMISHRQNFYGFEKRLIAHDPQVALSKEIAQRLVERDDRYLLLFRLAESVEQEILEKAQLHPTIDFYSVLSLHFLEVDPNLFSVFLCFSRAVGILAHITEQRERKDPFVL